MCTHSSAEKRIARVLVLCQGNCTLTKPVLFETLVINLSTGAQHVVIFSSFSFVLKSILWISATMTKTKINCFHISGVGSQPLGHTDTQPQERSVFTLRTSLLMVHSVPDQTTSARIKVRAV